MKLFKKLKQNWEAFLQQQHERWGQQSLDDLVNDDDWIEKNLQQENELPWQPYPVEGAAPPVLVREKKNEPN